MDVDPLSPRLAALLDDMPLEELAFTPVPVRARRDGWTPARQHGFILRLALSGCVIRAAAGVGMTKVGAYQLRDRTGAESFTAAWDRALGWGRKRATDLGLERVLYGEEIPVMYRGRRVDTRLRFDNRLLIAVLNATQPKDAPLSSLDATQDFQEALAAFEAAHGLTENK